MLTVASASTAVNATSLTATCPAANPIVVTGGFSGIGGGGNGQYVVESQAVGTNQWRVSLQANDNSWSVYAVCSK
jgi:hypothetical protein